MVSLFYLPGLTWIEKKIIICRHLNVKLVKNHIIIEQTNIYKSTYQEKEAISWNAEIF